MKDKVLIITSKFDEHADYIINLMNIRGMSDRVIRLNTEDFRINVEYTFDAKHFNILLRDSDIEFSEYDICSVWYRRPLDEKLVVSDKGVERFINSQINQFLNGLYYCLHDSALWVNDLQSDMFAKNKLFQLVIATQVGLLIPDVMISNDCNQVDDFFDTHERICNKSLSIPRYTYDGKLYPFMTRMISKVEYETNKDSLVFCPTFFEEYIEKEYDIRVVVMGNNVFAFAMYSQEHELSKIDVRGLSPLQIKHEYIKLPQYIENKILDFMKVQNLFFSSMDFMYSKEGEYYFVENNCNGQWLWLENLTGVNMSDVFIQALLKYEDC